MHDARSLSPVRRLGVLVAATALVAAGCGSAAGRSDSSAESYHILAVLALSGAFQSLGKGTVDALNVSADLVNKSGGVGGRKIELEFVDDQGDPTKAVSILQAKIDERKPDAAIAGSTSNESLAMLPILNRNKIINLGTNSSTQLNDPAKYPYTFRPVDPNENIAKATAQLFVAKGYKKIGIFTPNTASGDSGKAAFTAAVRKAGLTTVTASYGSSDVDVTAPLAQLQTGHPDAVIFLALGDAAPGVVLSSRLKAGMTAVPFYGDQSVTVDVTKLVPPAALPGAYVSTYSTSIKPAGGNPRPLAEFIDAVKARGPIVSTILAYTLAADCLRLLQAGAKAAGSTDADKMKSAIENLPDQPAGTWLTYSRMKFSPQNHFNIGTVPADYGSTPIGHWTDGQFVTAAR
ncbi:ABC transporter substrate-binding protein [Amycolatopsis sp. NPDC049253]|uniref:ABC transporter substrate-binding protein n=1 Tax=Amycolatopsis sp. NPDC049253 TaxID=3155274 RepID=UPI0034470E08